MIAEIGLASLWLAASLAALQFIAAWFGQRAGGETLARLVRPAAVVQALLCGLAFVPDFCCSVDSAKAIRADAPAFY